MEIAYISGALRVSTSADSETVGPRAHILGFLAGLRDQGHDCHTYILGDLIPQRLRRQAKERRMGLNRFASMTSDAARLAINPANKAAARMVLPRRRLELIYERFASFQMIGASLRSTRAPWVLETNGLFFREASEARRTLSMTRLARTIEVRAYRGCDVLVCVSEALRNLIVGETGIPAGKTLVLPNGVDTAFFTPSPHEHPRPTFTIGFVGSVVPWQRLDSLLHAVAMLRSDLPQLRVSIVGDGPELATLRHLAESLEISHLVRFHGRIPYSQVPDAIAGFDAGYAGHSDFGLGEMYHSPLKIYEYAAMGVPILASQHPDAEGLLKDGVTGVLFIPDDATSLAGSISKLVERREEFASRTARSRQVIVERHSWSSRVRSLIVELRTRNILR